MALGTQTSKEVCSNNDRKGDYVKMKNSAVLAQMEVHMEHTLQLPGNYSNKTVERTLSIGANQGTFSLTHMELTLT